MSTKFWKGGNAGVEGSFTETLTDKTLDNEAAVDNGDGTVSIPSTTHTFIVGDYVVINNTTSYDGNHKVVGVSGADDFEIVATYVTETFVGTETVKSSNWQDALGVPVAAPVTNDKIVFDEKAGIADDRSSRHIEGRHWRLIDDVAVGDTGEMDFNGVLFDVGYNGAISIDAENTVSAFHLSVNDGYAIDFKANIQAYLECSADDAITSINIPLLVHNTASGCLVISSDVNDGTWKSEWDLIKCFSGGTLILLANTVCQTIRTYNSSVTLIIDAGCVDTSDSDDPIDLYVDLAESRCATRVSKNTIVTEGAINFGSSAFSLTKGV